MVWRIFMNNYKSPNKPKKYSVDGFLATGPRRSANIGQKTAPTVIRSPKLNTLDEFSKKDGFRRQTVVSVNQDGSLKPSERSQVQEIDYSNKPNTAGESKKRFLRFGRKKNNNSGFKPNKHKRPYKKMIIIFLVLVIGVAGAFFGKAWWDAQRALSGGGGALALSKEIDPNSLNGEGDGRINVLLMGKGGDAHDGGQLTDTIMIASIDPINNGVVLLSVPRDLWVKPTGLWPMKINAVYNSAYEQAIYNNPKDENAAKQKAISATEGVVEENLGVNINYYAMVDFTAFEEAVNTLGGITVNLAEPYSDPTMRIGNKVLNLAAGPNNLDGGTALGLARSRYGADRGDFDRGQHQQAVLVGIKDKVLSMGTFVNPLKISQLFQTFGNRVATNFSTDDVMRMYEIMKKVPNESITHVDLAMEGEAVVTTANIGGQSVVVPIAGVNDFSEIQKFVRLKLKDGFIIKENPTIIVLNASGKTGAAAKRAEELKSYGYNVIQVADANISDVPVTQLIDNNNGQKKYTKRYLELRFNTQAVKKVDGLDTTPYIADYIVVIGQNG